MKIQVLSIKPSSNSTTYDVEIAIGSNRQWFACTIENVALNGHKLQVTHGDTNFSRIFRWNFKIYSDILKLVQKVHDGYAVDLPADMGELKDEALEVSI